MKEQTKEDKWVSLRIKKSTLQKMKLMKVKLDVLLYDEVIDYFLSKEQLEFKK